MIDEIQAVIWFLLPAIAANMAPVFAAHYNILPRLNHSIDNGVTWHGKRLFGAHKTYRGFLTGILAGGAVGALQGSVVIGAWTGFGALAGDAIKSFIKRRIHILPGESWKPWDQIDFVIGAIVASFWFRPFTFSELMSALVIVGFGSYLVSYLGVTLNIKPTI